MKVEQRETVLAEKVSVGFDTEREVVKRDAIHRACDTAIHVVHVIGGEQKRRACPQDARHAGHSPRLIVVSQMEDDPPRHRRIEHVVGERAGLDDATDGWRVRQVLRETVPAFLWNYRAQRRGALRSVERE
jgi:hypothetical protein